MENKLKKLIDNGYVAKIKVVKINDNNEYEETIFERFVKGSDAYKLISKETGLSIKMIEHICKSNVNDLISECLTPDCQYLLARATSTSVDYWNNLLEG